MKYKVLNAFGCIGVCILPISHEKPSALLLILLSKEIAEADEHVDVDVGGDHYTNRSVAVIDESTEIDARCSHSQFITL